MRQFRKPSHHFKGHLFINENKLSQYRKGDDMYCEEIYISFLLNSVTTLFKANLNCLLLISDKREFA